MNDKEMIRRALRTRISRAERAEVEAAIERLASVDLDAAESALRTAQMKLPMAGQPEGTLKEKLERQRRFEVRGHISDALRAIGRHS